ncbi:MAG: YceI family protein [Pseudomonadales bacterium]
MRQFRVNPRVAGQLRALAALLGCAACASIASASEETPATASEGLAAGFDRCYLVRDDRSELTVLVYREGPLARFGHNHVIASHALSGVLALTDPVAGSHLLITVPAASLEVDPPALRAREGRDFAAHISSDARAATRTNMLGPRVLDAQRFPDMEVEISSPAGTPSSMHATALIRIRGMESEHKMTASVLEDSSGLHIESAFAIAQSSLGLEPFSVAMGALHVADRLQVKVSLSLTPSGEGDLRSCLAQARVRSAQRPSTAS